MPLWYYEQINDALQFGVWMITENEQELLSHLFLNKEEFELLQSFRSEKRRKQWLSYRVLIRTIVQTDFIYRIDYDEHGKPFLTNPPRNISISHSGNLSAVLICSDLELQHGLDIQHVCCGIQRVLPRVMTDEELKAWREHEDIIHAYYYWCAKEAVFKIEGKKLPSLQHVFIHPFMPGQKETNARTSFGTYRVYFRNFYPLVSAIAIKEKQQ